MSVASVFQVQSVQFRSVPDYNQEKIYGLARQKTQCFMSYVSW